MSSSLDSQQERSRRSPVIDVDRFLRIGRQAGKGRERRARVVDRRSDKDDASASSSSSSSSCSYVSEPARRVRVAERADVLVVGGGCAGLAAAVAAKKVSPSLNVLLVEKEEYLGGTISRVGMESVSWWMYNDAVKSDGLVKELEDLATSMQGTTTFPYNEGLNLTSEPFKRVADAFVTRHGVRCLFATWVADTIVEASPGSSSGDPVPCLKGVYVENVAGRQAILAERVVDCTGNADVLHRAGGRFTVLPVDQRMGITQVFSVSNVDRERFLEYTERKAATYNNWGNDGGPKVCETEWKQETQGSEGELRTPYLEREFQEAEVKGIVPKGSNINGSWSTLTHDGELLNLNLVHMQGDALDPWDMSEMAQVGREKVGEAIKALKTIPGCEDAKLRTFSNNLGVRDSRKCVAKYNLSGEDALAGSRFEDSVCVLPQIVDGYGILVLGSEGGEVEVPLRGFQCDVDNLMVAGRCFAGDHVSHCLTRNIKCCMLTGQAAGAIAATSLRTKTSVWNVRPQDVREDLTRVGFRNNTRGGRASAVVASRRSVGVRAVAPREEGEAEASAVAKQLGQSALVALSVMSVAPDAFAKGGELGILEGRTIALLHPAMMFALLGATGYIGYLGWQWRRVRTVGDEIAELKKEAKTMAKKAELVTAGAGGAVEESGEASVGSPLDATISELQVTRKKLIEGKFRDKHYVWGSLLLAAGVTFSIEGGLNTYLRTGKLFPGPHLFAGASMTAMWAIAAALTPAMQKGNKLARDAHIALNGLTFLLFLWQVPTGLEIVGKVFQFTKWP